MRIYVLVLCFFLFLGLICCEVSGTPRLNIALSKGAESVMFTEQLYDLGTTEYYGVVEIGTPPQQFNILFQTASTVFYVPSNLCGNSCQGMNKYDVNASSSAVITSSTADAIYVEDDVNVGGLVVSNQKFAALNQLPNTFDSTGFDGIIGMGPSDTGNTFFYMAVEQHGLDPVYSFYLDSSSNSNSSVLTLGGYDTKYFSGPITYLPFLQQEGLYMVNFDSISVGNESISTNCPRGCRAIPDTGTSVIVGPSDVVAEIASKISLNPNCEGIDSLPDVIFRVGNTNFAIPPSIYVLKEQTSNGNTKCILGIEGTNNNWLWGDVFIRAWYSIFNVETKQLGLARSINP